MEPIACDGAPCSALMWDKEGGVGGLVLPQLLMPDFVESLRETLPPLEEWMGCGMGRRGGRRGGSRDRG